MGNFIIRFFDHNGMRPIIVLVVICGGIYITSNSKDICVIQETRSVSGSQTQIILKDNPVCSKYFEMAALIIGGILGLTVPGKVSDAKDSDNDESKQNQSEQNEKLKSNPPTPDYEPEIVSASPHHEP